MSETASLMLVVGEPFTEDKKEPILRRISNGRILYILYYIILYTLFSTLLGEKLVKKT